VDADSVDQPSVAPVVTPFLPEASSTTPSIEAVAPIEDRGIPAASSVAAPDEKGGIDGQQLDAEAAANLPVVREALGDIEETNATGTDAEPAVPTTAGEVPADGEETKPELPVASSADKPEAFHVPRDAKSGYKKELKSLVKAERAKVKRKLTNTEMQELREQALEAHYQKEAARIQSLDSELEEIRNDPVYKAEHEAVEKLAVVNLKPGELINPGQVERNAISAYLQARDADNDKKSYERWKKKLGFGKMIAEILLAVGLSTGEQAGTQSVRPLQPGR
jgi:hypothetical protein